MLVYTCGMKRAKLFVHPDVVVGEPIPEVEPRIDYDRLAIVRRWNRWWRWCLMVAFVLIAALAMTGSGLGVGIGVLVVFLVFWLAPVVHPKMRAEVRKFREANRLKGFSQGNIWSVPCRDNIENQIMSGSLFVIAPVMVNSSSGLRGGGVYVGMYAFIGGIALLIYGFRVRQPGQISCEECSYSLVGLSLPCRCPECGVYLLDPSYTTDCPRIRSPWFWRAGVAVFVLGGLLMYASVIRPGFLYAPMPRSVLLRLAPTDRDAFERYTQGPMSVAQTNELVEALIERSRKGRLEYSQERWLEDLMEAGGLSGEQVALYMEGVPAIVIDGPREMKVGEEVEISLASTRNTRSMVSYFFEGFRVGDDPALYSGSDHSRRWRFLYKDLFRAESIAEDPANRPFYMLKAETAGGAGEIVVRGRVVVVLTGWKNMMTFEWGEDGEGVFENDPVWVRVVDLEHRILVTE